MNYRHHTLTHSPLSQGRHYQNTPVVNLAESSGSSSLTLTPEINIAWGEGHPLWNFQNQRDRIPSGYPRPENQESLADTESVSEEGFEYDPYDSDQKRKKRHRGKKERNTSNRNLIDYEVIPRIQSSRQEVTKGKKVLNKHKKPHMDTPTNHPPRHNRGGRGGGGGRGRGRDARAPNPAGAQTHR